MMVRKFIMLILPAALFFSSSLPAQQSDDASKSERPSFGIHVMPLSLTNIKSRYRIGAMLRYKSMSYLLDISYGDGSTPNWLFDDNSGILFKGIRPEIRYHFPNWNSSEVSGSGAYIGLEVPFSRMERLMFERNYTDNDGQRYHFESARKVRTRVTGIAKAGYVIFIDAHWYLDIYGGVGAGVRNVTYRNETGKTIIYNRDFGESLLSGDADLERTARILELALGFRMGYAF